MDKSDEERKKRNIALKIVIPIIIVGIIIAIAAVKNQTKPVEVNNEDFSLATSSINIENLKSYGLPIVIDFGSEGCVPCDLMAPVLTKLNQEWRGKVIVKI